MNIAVLPGDGIGSEIIAEAVKVLNALNLGLEMEWADVGGVAYAAHLGGAIPGLICGFILRHLRARRAEEFDI